MPAFKRFRTEEYQAISFKQCKDIFDEVLKSNDEDGFMIPKSKTGSFSDYEWPFKYYFKEYLKSKVKPPAEQMIEVATKIHRFYFSVGERDSYPARTRDYHRLKYLNMFKTVHPLFKSIKVKELSKRIDTLFKNKAKDRIQEGKHRYGKLNIAIEIIVSVSNVALKKYYRMRDSEARFYEYNDFMTDMLKDFFEIFKVTDKRFRCDPSYRHVEEQFLSSIGKKIHQLGAESFVFSEKDNEAKEVEFYSDWGREKKVLKNHECLLTFHKLLAKPPNVKLPLLGKLKDFVKKGPDRDYKEITIDTNRLMSGFTIQPNKEHLKEVKEILREVCVQFLRYSMKETILFDRTCFWMLRLDLEDTKKIDFEPVTRMVEMLNTSKEFKKLKELKQSLEIERKKNKRNRRYWKKDRNQENKLKTKFDKLFMTVCKTKILNTSNAEVEDSLLSLKQDILKVCLNCKSSDLFKGRTVKKIIDSYQGTTFVVMENLYLPWDSLNKDVEVHSMQGFFALAFFHAFFSDETHDEDVSRFLFERFKRIPQSVEDVSEPETELRQNRAVLESEVRTDVTNLPNNSNISNNEKPKRYEWSDALLINLSFEAHMDFKHEFLKSNGTMVYLINRDHFLTKFPEFQPLKEEFPEKLVFKIYSFDLLYEHSQHRKWPNSPGVSVSKLAKNEINAYDKITRYNSEVSEEKRIFVPKIFSSGWFEIKDHGKVIDNGRFHITEYIEPTGIQLRELRDKYFRDKDEELKKILEGYVQQANKIFLIFDELGIEHRSIAYRNFLLHNEKLCVLDFSSAKIIKPQNVDDDNGERKARDYGDLERLIIPLI